MSCGRPADHLVRVDFGGGMADRLVACAHHAEIYYQSTLRSPRAIAGSKTKVPAKGACRCAPIRGDVRLTTSREA